MNNNNETVINNKQITMDFSFAVVFLLVYCWMLIATPQVRFSILGDIQLEKILVLLIFVNVFFSKSIHLNFTTIGRWFLLLYVWIFISFLMSNYNDTFPAVYWIENYWKLVFVFMLTVWVLSTKNRLQSFIIGLAAILFLYQLHSWIDFIRGGSYVFQQGIKRIIGVWSGGGIGAPNGFSMLALFSVPFSIYIFNSFDNKKIKAFGLFYLFLSCLSIIFSGTRGALLSLVAYLLFMYGLKNLKAVFLMLGLVGVIFIFLPEDIQHRYTGTIFLSQEQKIDLSDTDKIATASGESRIEGLIDGFNMALNKPFFGYGPGASGYARHEVREYKYENQRVEDTSFLGLHSLYGQVISEAGFAGGILFMFLIFATYRQMYSLERDDKISDEFKNIKILVSSCLTVLLAYGFFGHIFYRFHWVFVYALAVAVFLIEKNERSCLKK